MSPVLIEYSTVKLANVYEKLMKHWSVIIPYMQVILISITQFE